MVVYLDLVLLLNFAVDLLLILGTNRLAGFPPGIRRAAAAAALGAVYGAVCLLPEFSFLGNTLWRLVFLGIMGATAFGLDAGAWKRTGIFVLLTMAMGGIALGLGKTGVPMLLLSALGVWILSHIGFGGSVGGKEYVPVTVREGQRTVSVIALKDTGNSLRDPITGEQVLLLDSDAAMRLLDLTREQLLHPMETVMTTYGLRLIPYSSVGQPGGLLIAKRFADVKVGQKQGSALVGFAPERIGAGQVYRALTGGNI